MRILPLLSAALAWLALGTACAGVDSAPTDDGAFVPEADRWDDIMEHVVGPAFDDYLIREAEREDGPMNLEVVAAQATRAANHIALGHGALEWKNVPRFAEYARESEAWLRQIAARAAAGDADRVRTLIFEGEVDHCDRCHVAAR